jgi:hypothetical protein
MFFPAAAILELRVFVVYQKFVEGAFGKMDGQQEQQGDWIMAHAFVSLYNYSNLHCQVLGLSLA